MITEPARDWDRRSRFISTRWIVPLRGSIWCCSSISKQEYAPDNYVAPAPATSLVSPAVSTPARLCFYLSLSLGSGVSTFAPGIVFSTPAFANDGGTGSNTCLRNWFWKARGWNQCLYPCICLTSLASSGQLQWDLEQAITIYNWLCYPLSFYLLLIGI